MGYIREKLRARAQWQNSVEVLRVGVGSSFLWAWGFLCYLSPCMFPPASTSGQSIGLENGFFTSQAFVVIFVIALLIASRRKSIRISRGMLLAAALLISGSTACLALALRIPSSELLFACGAVDGVCVTLLSCAWGARYSLGTKRTRPLVVLSFLFAYLEYLIVPLLPTPLDDVIIALLPLASWLLWRLDAGARHAQTSDVFPTKAQDEAMPGEVSAGAWETRILPWRAMSVLIVASFVGNLVGSILMGASYELATNLFSMGVVICALIATMSLVPLAYSDDTLSVTSLYRITITFTAIGLVGIMVFGEAAYNVCGMFAHGAAFFLQVLMYVVITQSTQEEGTSPLLSFAVGQALISGVVLFGNILGKQLPETVFSDTSTLALVCGASMLLLFFMLIAQTEALASDVSTIEQRAAERERTLQSEAQKQESEPTQDSEDDRVNALAREYGLTKRETEVYGYLARGRSLPYIANALFVTTGTVKTHTSHIYRKMGINSKQELMDMLDAE